MDRAAVAAQVAQQHEGGVDGTMFAKLRRSGPGQGRALFLGAGTLLFP